jgi:hypothetical protein
MPETTYQLGAEWDEKRLRALGDVLRELGAKLVDKWGDQDLVHWDVLVGDNRLVVETETYEGLTISGDAELVTQVAERFGQRLEK